MQSRIVMCIVSWSLYRDTYRIVTLLVIHSTTNLCTLILKQPLMSIMDQIDQPWQTANIFVLFNAFKTFCFPQCITDMSQVYFSSVNV